MTSYLKYLQKLRFAKTNLPIIVGTTILSSLITQPVRAFNVTFSFDPAADNSDPTVINDWNHGGSVRTTDGWTSGQNQGTATDLSTGISITFTGAPPSSTSDPYLSGTAESRESNFTFDPNNLTTPGLKISNEDDSDGNGITLTIGTTSDTLSGGTLQNYQLLTFEFSEPIVIDSGNQFFIDDIDDRRTNRASSDIYIDSVAVEGFATSSVGTPGAGIDPNFSFEDGTDNDGNYEASNLKIGSIDFANGNDVNYVYDSINSTYNPANKLQSRAYYDFGLTPVQSVALYYFNGLNTTVEDAHAITVGGSFTVEDAATAVPFEFSPGLGLLVSGGGLLGIKRLRRGKLQK